MYLSLLLAAFLLFYGGNGRRQAKGEAVPGARASSRRRASGPRDAHAQRCAQVRVSPPPCGAAQRAGSVADLDLRWLARVCIFSSFRRSRPQPSGPLSPPCGVCTSPPGGAHTRRAGADSGCAQGLGSGTARCSLLLLPLFWCAAVRFDPVDGRVIPSSHTHLPRRPPRPSWPASHRVRAPRCCSPGVWNSRRETEDTRRCRPLAVGWLDRPGLAASGLLGCGSRFAGIGKRLFSSRTPR